MCVEFTDDFGCTMKSPLHSAYDEFQVARVFSRHDNLLALLCLVEHCRVQLELLLHVEPPRLQHHSVVDLLVPVQQLLSYRTLESRYTVHSRV